MARALTLINVVKAVQRIPVELRGKITFFSVHDTWVYHAVFDEEFCPLCQEKAVPFTYAGNALRREFPFLEIEGENRIKANVHKPRDDNCRCWLERVVDEPSDSEEERFEERLEEVKEPKKVVDEAVREFERKRRGVRID